MRLGLSACIWWMAQAICFAQPALVASKSVVFPGENLLTLTWTNRGKESVDQQVTAKIFQSATRLAMQLPGNSQERLQLAANQAALMPVRFDAPAVRGKTDFVLRWTEGEKLLGTNDVTVYPREILHEVQMMAGEVGLGVAGPTEFKNAFVRGKAAFKDLQLDDARGFRGGILIVNDPSASERAYCKAFGAVARSGAVVICIVTPNADDLLRPNFFAVPNGRGIVVFVQEQFIENFAANPEAQLRLIEICRLATTPGRSDLPIIFPKDLYEK